MVEEAKKVRTEHWYTEQSAYRMDRDHRPVVILYDRTPGGVDNGNGTRSYSMRFPALAFTEWVAEPEKVVGQIVDALNQVKLKQALAVIDTLLKAAEDAREEWDKAPSTMKAGKLLIAIIDPSLKYRADITEAHRIHALLKKED